MSGFEQHNHEPLSEDMKTELRMIAAREVASLLGCALVLIMMHPGVKLWLDHQTWRFRQRLRRGADAEETAVAELRRDISRYEHGEAAL